jgi:hypothetical protein
VNLVVLQTPPNTTLARFNLKTLEKNLFVVFRCMAVRNVTIQEIFSKLTFRLVPNYIWRSQE